MVCIMPQTTPKPLPADEKEMKMWREPDPTECEGCGGWGNLSMHGVDGQCGMCNGTGATPTEDGT